MALLIDQEGTGNSAKFKGGGGVEISGVSGDNNALRLSDVDTASPALLLEQKGTGNAMHIVQQNKKDKAGWGTVVNEATALQVDQEGTGNSAVFKGGGGVDISGVSGDNNALRLFDVNTNTKHSALVVIQKGEGKAAYFGGNVKVTGHFVDDVKVKGNITLGNNLSAVAGEEKLRIVRGIVKAATTSYENGFKVEGYSTTSHVKFSPSFLDVPVITVTTVDGTAGEYSVCSYISKSGFYVATWQRGGHKSTTKNFHFIAIGLR
jgi:hypothetical protein